MSASYESAKRVALGMEHEKKTAAPLGDDLWNVSLGGGFGFAAEMPFQFFEKGFEPPDEQTAQKAGLMLYEEYTSDQKTAEARFDTLKALLAASDLSGLKKLLADAPLVQWMSLIFLDGDRLRDELVPQLEASDAVCRAAFSAAADEALRQLVDYRDLLETLQKHC